MSFFSPSNQSESAQKMAEALNQCIKDMEKVHEFFKLKNYSIYENYAALIKEAKKLRYSMNLDSKDAYHLLACCEMSLTVVCNILHSGRPDEEYRRVEGNFRPELTQYVTVPRIMKSFMAVFIALVGAAMIYDAAIFATVLPAAVSPLVLGVALIAVAALYAVKSNKLVSFEGKLRTIFKRIEDNPHSFVSVILPYGRQNGSYVADKDFPWKIGCSPYGGHDRYMEHFKNPGHFSSLKK